MESSCHNLDINYFDLSGVFWCNECTHKGKSGKRFQDWDGLKRHLEDRHDFMPEIYDFAETSEKEGEDYFVCEECDKRWHSAGSYCNHMNACHGTEINQSQSGMLWCNACDKRCNGFRGLRMHMEREHGKDI